MTARRARRLGFTLLEVMIAVVILAVGLSSLFTSEAGAVKIAQRARTTTIATLLARCKMGEIEEKILKEGWPSDTVEERDACCTDGEHDGYTCEWKIERIKLPDMSEGDAGVGGGSDDKDDKGGDKEKSKPKSGMLDQLSELSKGDPSERMNTLTDVLSGSALKNATGSGTSDDEDRDAKSDKEQKKREKYGLDQGAGADPITSMVMGMAFPIMKPVIEEGVRRASVNVKWKEGERDHNFEVVQFIVSEQQIILPEGDDENAQPGVAGATGTGATGTGTAGATGTSSTSTTTTTNTTGAKK